MLVTLQVSQLVILIVLLFVHMMLLLRCLLGPVACLTFSSTVGVIAGNVGVIFIHCIVLPPTLYGGPSILPCPPHSSLSYQGFCLDLLMFFEALLQFRFSPWCSRCAAFKSTAVIMVCIHGSSCTWHTCSSTWLLHFLHLWVAYFCHLVRPCWTVPATLL